MGAEEAGRCFSAPPRKHARVARRALRKSGLGPSSAPECSVPRPRPESTRGDEPHPGRGGRHAAHRQAGRGRAAARRALRGLRRPGPPRRARGLLPAGARARAVPAAGGRTQVARRPAATSRPGKGKGHRAAGPGRAGPGSGPGPGPGRAAGALAGAACGPKTPQPRGAVPSLALSETPSSKRRKTNKQTSHPKANGVLKTIFQHYLISD